VEVIENNGANLQWTPKAGDKRTVAL